MLRINQLKLAPDHTEQELKKLLLTTLHLKEEELLETLRQELLNWNR